MVTTHFLIVVTPRSEVFGDCLGNANIVRSDDLASILPVDLVTVICSRVVGGSNHNSSTAIVRRNDKRLKNISNCDNKSQSSHISTYHKRSEGKLVETINLDSLLCKYLDSHVKEGFR